MAITKKILDEVVFESYPKIEQKGGQTCGTMPTGITLICKAAGFEVSINNYRSQIKNRELAILLFELYLSQIAC
jgi:protein subunit release factor B